MQVRVKRLGVGRELTLLSVREGEIQGKIYAEIKIHFDIKRELELEAREKHLGAGRTLT